MEIKKSPNIAILFGAVAVITSIVLVMDTPRIINYLLAVFWFLTGLLGFYVSLKGR